MLFFNSAWQAQSVYNVTRQGFLYVTSAVFPILLFVNAPFGRFTPSEKGLFRKGIFEIHGIKSWILMELVAPITFAYMYLHSPLNIQIFGRPPVLSLSHPSNLLASLFLVHYANRAVISPLRTPSRSKSHLIVVLAAVAFNLTNGFLMAAHLSSPFGWFYLMFAYRRPRFWVGLSMWIGGFAGNILHDEVLLNLRRENERKKAQAAKDGDSTAREKGEHYGIPQGYLYRFISYPNYFCEWIEWTGFALAASPLPSTTSWAAFRDSLTGPHLFLLAEIFTMLPRAIRGHQWYHERFPNYPKERKAVIPFLI